MLRIIKLNQGIFTVFEKGIPNSEIILDFNPFVKKNDLKQGVIIHLRARPPQQACHWTYGIYEVEFDNYFSVNNVQSSPEYPPKFFSEYIPELTTKPTHVLIYPTAIMSSKSFETILLGETNAVAEAIDDAPLKKVKK